MARNGARSTFPQDVEAAGRAHRAMGRGGQSRGRPEMEALRIPVGDESVSALLTTPGDAKALYVFAHGAGAGMMHKSMAVQRRRSRGAWNCDAALSISVHGEGIETAGPAEDCACCGSSRCSRSDEAGGRPAAVRRRTVVRRTHDLADAGRFAAFRSTRARIPRASRFTRRASRASSALSICRVSMCRCYSSPALAMRLAEMDLLKGVVAGLGDLATLHVVADADHSLKVPAKSGRTPASSRGRSPRRDGGVDARLTLKAEGTGRRRRGPGGRAAGSPRRGSTSSSRFRSVFRRRA